MRLTYGEAGGSYAVAAIDEDGDLHVFNEHRGSICFLLSGGLPTTVEFEPKEYEGEFVHFFYPDDQLTITF